jgi:hypothetical protein
VLALKHVGAVNIEQYNKLSVKCAFVCALYVHIVKGCTVQRLNYLNYVILQSHFSCVI